MQKSSVTNLQRWFYGTATTLIVAVLVWLTSRVLSRVITVLTVLALGTVLAFLLSPIAGFIESRIKRRWLAVIILLLALAAIILFGIFLVIGPLVSDLMALLEELPAYIQQVESLIRQADVWLMARGLRGQAEDAILELLDALRTQAPSVLAATAVILGKAGSRLTELALAIVVATYFLLDGNNLRRRIYGVIPPDFTAPVEQMEAVVSRIVGGYLRGQLLLALIIGVAAGIGMAVLGLPYPVFLGVMAGFFELVPTVGAVLGALPAVLIAAFESFPKMLYVAIFFFVLQQIESALLVPRITSATVGLHPVVAILALLAGFEVAGIMGALLAVPIVAATWGLLTIWLPWYGGNESATAGVTDTRDDRNEDAKS